MKKTFLWVALVLPSFTLSAQAACPAVSLPAKFTETEDLISIGTDMTLKEGKNALGSIQERVLNLTPTFDLLNEKNQQVARAKQKMWTWGTTIDIKDCEGNKIGTIREKIWTSWLRLMTEYEIYDGRGELIGMSEKREFFSTSFTITATNGHIAFKMFRSAFNLLSDKWQVTVVNANVIDSRLVLMIPAFKTSADNRQRASQEN